MSSKMARSRRVLGGLAAAHRCDGRRGFLRATAKRGASGARPYRDETLNGEAARAQSSVVRIALLRPLGAEGSSMPKSYSSDFFSPLAVGAGGLGGRDAE